MRQFLTTALLPVLGIAASASPAWAACSGDSGYVYVWHLCVQERVSGRPQNVCEVSKDTRDLKTVTITSNVLFDDVHNGRYPGTIFFNELQNQISLTANGRESHCYRTRREAEDELRQYIADRRRSGGDGALFVTVHMPNS